jgi:hypothetical protein
MKDLLGQAHASGVPVYGVSPLGLVAPTPRHVMPSANISAGEARDMALMLKWVSEATGGRAIMHDNEPARRVSEVFEENSHFYTLAYEAPGAMADGRYRRLEVRVNRTGVTLQPGGERMFFSPKPGTVRVATTTRALSGLVPLADEPLRLAVAVVADPDAEAGSNEGLASFTLALAIPADPDATADEIATETRIFDAEGRREVAVRRQSVRVPANRSDSVREVELLSTVSLKPGRYNIRMSVHSIARDRSGSVHTDFVVPDFGRAAMSVSDAVIVSPLSRRPIVLDASAGAPPWTPSTMRAFATNDRASAMLRVHWRDGRAAAPVTIAATILDTDNRQLFSRTTSVAAPTPAAGQRPFADYRLDLPLADLLPGEHLLTLTIRPATGAPQTRYVRFTILDRQ